MKVLSIVGLVMFYSVTTGYLVKSINDCHQEIKAINQREELRITPQSVAPTTPDTPRAFTTPMVD